MNNLEAQKLYEGPLKGFAQKKFKKKEDQEDFRAWCIIKRLKGRKATFSQLYVDYLRHTKGDMRIKWFKLKRNVLCPVAQYKEDYTNNPDQKGVGVSKLKSDYTRIRIIDNFNEEMFKNLKQFDRIIIVLYFVWNFTLEEIGYCFGLSESRISQKLKKIIIKTKKEFGNKNIKEFLNDRIR